MNIIFIDIDGPLIPGRSYILGHRPGIEEIGAKFLKELCSRCDAKLVACTTYAGRGKDLVLNMFVLKDIYERDFHSDWSIKYPNRGLTRQEAVKVWLEENPGVNNYVIIDDARHDDPNWIEVHPEIGITLENYRKATNILGNPDDFVVLL